MLSEERKEEVVHTTEGTPRWMGAAIVALAAVSLLALGVGWSATNHVRDAQQAAANDNKVLRQNLEVVTQRLAQAESANAQVQGDLGVVTDRLQLTQGELDKSRKTAGAIKQDYSKKLTAMQDKVQADEAQIATKASTDDVNAVSTNVNGVRTDLDATKQNLLDAKGELGTQIARTHEDIEALRRLGQRDYYEFTLAGKNAKQRVGNISVELHGVNVSRHQYTVELYVDDLKLEKKNRAVNEPIFFYAGNRASMELVVNKVDKDKIVGYLSVPKVQTASAAAPASGGGK
jgi:chromosome segregation ATPase